MRTSQGGLGTAAEAGAGASYMPPDERQSGFTTSAYGLAYRRQSSVANLTTVPIEKIAADMLAEVRNTQVKRLVHQGSEAFQRKDYSQAVVYFTKALSMAPSSKWMKWLYKNRCARCALRLVRTYTQCW